MLCEQLGWIYVVLVVSWRIPHETHVSPSFPNSNPSLCWIMIEGYELNVMLCNSCLYDDSTLGYV